MKVIKRADGKIEHIDTAALEMVIWFDELTYEAQKRKEKK